MTDWVKKILHIENDAADVTDIKRAALDLWKEVGKWSIRHAAQP